jgi:hypothetical protein
MFMDGMDLDKLIVGKIYKFFQFAESYGPDIEVYEIAPDRMIGDERKKIEDLNLYGGYISRDKNNVYHVWNAENLGLIIEVPLMEEYIKRSDLVMGIE